MANSKQRLFEVMQKVDKTFKPKINENFNSIPSEYQIEFDNLKKEYGDNVVNSFFTSGLPGFYDSRTRGNYSLDAIKQNLNHLKVNEDTNTDSQDFVKITTPIGSTDDKLFVGIVNQGIDSHLEGFTKSEFSDVAGSLGRRRILNFHKSEIPILLRRLEEIGTEEALQWKDDIENYDKNINEVNEELLQNTRKSFKELMSFTGYAKKVNPVDSPEYKYYIDVLNFVNGNNNVYEKAELIKKFQNEFLGIDYDILQTPAEMVAWWLSPEQQGFIKSELNSEESLDETQQGINPKYTHFAVTKDTNQIVNGWEYGDIEPVELRQFKKDYFFNDLSEMGIDPRNINVVSTKYLQSSGINPFDTKNWK